MKSSPVRPMTLTALVLALASLALAADFSGKWTASFETQIGTQTYTYDPVTLMVASETDANNQTTRYEYDVQGNRTKVTNALNQITTFTYESVFNKMTTMTDPNGRTTTYEYDGRGNRIRETDPLRATRDWTSPGRSRKAAWRRRTRCA